MPGLTQACPNSAACWSPAMPATGISAPRMALSAYPNSPLLSFTSGKSEAGILRRRSSSSSQRCSMMLNMSVRPALVGSVAWTLPPVRRDSRKQSIVPNASSPRSARARAPDTLSRIQASLVPEKYGSSRRPVLSVTIDSAPSAFSLAQRSAVRRSCHTIALWIGLPVARSQTTTVSRWLVIPMAAISAISTFAWATAPRRTSTVSRQMSSGSCSTQPGFG